MKKILSLLLMVAMVLSVVSVPVFGAYEETYDKTPMVWDLMEDFANANATGYETYNNATAAAAIAEVGSGMKYIYEGGNGYKYEPNSDLARYVGKQFITGIKDNATVWADAYENADVWSIGYSRITKDVETDYTYLTDAGPINTNLLADKNDYKIPVTDYIARFYSDTTAYKVTRDGYCSFVDFTQLTNAHNRGGAIVARASGNNIKERQKYMWKSPVSGNVVLSVILTPEAQINTTGTLTVEVSKISGEEKTVLDTVSGLDVASGKQNISVLAEVSVGDVICMAVSASNNPGVVYSIDEFKIKEAKAWNFINDIIEGTLRPSAETSNITDGAGYIEQSFWAKSDSVVFDDLYENKGVYSIKYEMPVTDANVILSNGAAHTSVANIHKSTQAYVSYYSPYTIENKNGWKDVEVTIPENTGLQANDLTINKFPYMAIFDSELTAKKPIATVWGTIKNVIEWKAPADMTVLCKYSATKVADNGNGSGTNIIFNIRKNGEDLDKSTKSLRLKNINDSGNMAVVVNVKAGDKIEFVAYGSNKQLASYYIDEISVTEYPQDELVFCVPENTVAQNANYGVTATMAASDSKTKLIIAEYGEEGYLTATSISSAEETNSLNASYIMNADTKLLKIFAWNMETFAPITVNMTYSVAK